MKTKRLQMVAIALAMLMIPLLVATKLVYAADTDNANRMNVVFVLDQSGSMANTDPTALRHEAVELFLGLATDTGNNMGAVVFDDGIVLKEDIKPIDGVDAKNLLLDHIKKANSNGDTDIGKAIDLATDMLMQQGDPDMDSVIILLSDGNTDLPKDTTGTALAASEASKQHAIANAQAQGINIHSVCLNINGAAKVQECQDISNPTGGTCVEVKSANDLKEVFSQFYNIIYSTKTIELADTVIGPDGSVTVDFTVPPIGVEEANIIINTLNEDTKYQLTDPNQKTFSDADLEAMTIKARTFAVIKVQEPEGGDWKLTAYGIPGDQIKVDMVYNANLLLQNTTNGGNSACSVGDNVVIAGEFINNGIKIADDSVYQQFPMKALITNIATQQQSEISLNPASGCASGTFTVPESADYEVVIVTKVGDMELESNIAQLFASNTIPTTSKSVIKITKLVTPFSKAHIEDMSQYVSDKEDAVLHYQITDTDYDVDVAYIDQTNLCIEVKDAKNGELVVTASDSQGASVDVKVQVKLISFFAILFLILGLIVLLIALIFIIRNISINSRVIRGSLYIVPFDEDSTDEVIIVDGSRGKMFLSRIIDTNLDIGIVLGKTYFLGGAKGERAIYLNSANGYFTDMNPGQKLKKIQVYEEMEITVSPSEDLERGLKITYRKEDY